MAAQLPPALDRLRRRYGWTIRQARRSWVRTPAALPYAELPGLLTTVLAPPRITRLDHPMLPIPAGTLVEIRLEIQPVPTAPPAITPAMRTCARKEPFDRWDMAEKAASRVRRRDRDPGMVVEPFVCPYCQKFHVGSRPKHPERIDLMLASYEEE